MDASGAVELGREAILLALTCAAPVLLAGLAVGILAGLLQSMFQVHDQVAGLVPRLAAMAIVFLLTLPWMAHRLEEFGRNHFSGPPFPAVQAESLSVPDRGQVQWPGR